MLLININTAQNTISIDRFVCVYNAEWDENKHSRDKNGQFAPKEQSDVSISTREILNGRTEEQFRSDMISELFKLKGETVSNSSLGVDIEIRMSSLRKYKSFIGDTKKLYIVPHLKKIIGNTDFSKIEKPYDKRETSIRSYYKGSSEVKIDGISYNVHITVKEDQQGHYFWDAQIK